MSHKQILDIVESEILTYNGYIYREIVSMLINKKSESDIMAFMDVQLRDYTGFIVDTVNTANENIKNKGEPVANGTADIPVDKVDAVEPITVPEKLHDSTTEKSTEEVESKQGGCTDTDTSDKKSDSPPIIKILIEKSTADTSVSSPAKPRLDEKIIMKRHTGSGVNVFMATFNTKQWGDMDDDNDETVDDGHVTKDIPKVAAPSKPVIQYSKLTFKKKSEKKKVLSPLPEEDTSPDQEWTCPSTSRVPAKRKPQTTKKWKSHMVREPLVVRDSFNEFGHEKTSSCAPWYFTNNCKFVSCNFKHGTDERGYPVGWYAYEETVVTKNKCTNENGNGGKCKIVLTADGIDDNRHCGQDSCGSLKVVTLYSSCKGTRYLHYVDGDRWRHVNNKLMPVEDDEYIGSISKLLRQPRDKY